MKLARGGDFFLNEGTRPAQGTIARSGTFSIDRIGLNGFLPGFSAGNMKAHEGQRGRAGDGKGGGGGGVKRRRRRMAKVTAEISCNKSKFPKFYKFFHSLQWDCRDCR